MYSENKYLLLISVGPKTAPPPGREIARKRGEKEPARSNVKLGLCGFASRRRRASSEQQRSKVGFPIRKFTDQSLFAAPRDLSQRTTSFIASQRQGIHRTPLRHLIALIAKARPFHPPIGNRRRTFLGLKRPVLLQTHPGIRAVRLQIHDWLLDQVGSPRNDSRPRCSLEHPSAARRKNPAFDRMRFLFTMSDIVGERPWARAPSPAGRPSAKRPAASPAGPGRNRSNRTERISKPHRPSTDGGARRDRTDDLMLAKHALSQLSYGPVAKGTWWAWEDLNLRPHAYQARALTN